MPRVTFDTNVWRSVVSPENHRSGGANAQHTLHAAIRGKRIQGFLPETIFTLDGPPRKQKAPLVKGAGISGEWSKQFSSNGIHLLNLTIGYDIAAHPGNDPETNVELKRAINLGFRLLRCSRAGSVRNPDLEQGWYEVDSGLQMDRRMERFAQCAKLIEERGGGIAYFKKICEQYAQPSEAWYWGILHAPPTKARDAVAEWADGDALSAHFAYQNDYFCTDDRGRSSGSRSVLSIRNRRWLHDRVEVRVASPEELCLLLNLDDTHSGT